MILANGQVYEPSAQRELLDGLEQEINDTRARGRLLSETVISAVEKLRAKIMDGEFEGQIEALARSGVFGSENLRGQIAQVLELLKREHLEYKLRIELGDAADGSGARELYGEYKTAPSCGQKPLRVRTVPLGTLFHIAAGNVDGLPVYSVLEGLLVGNVNVLKLPQTDNGLSVEILRELLAIEPKLAPYIYVFDTPSEDIAAMRRMADLSDGIVVWASDAAVRAVRQMAKPGTRLIEWGHKLGFAYLSGYEDKERELAALAEHIIDTGGLLCSSCQTIFLDTEEMEEAYAFCEEFLPYLQAAADSRPQSGSNALGTRAEISLRRYSDTVDAVLAGSAESGGNAALDARKVFYGHGCSLTAAEDSELELSYMFGNCLVKRLPRGRIFAQLRRSKGYLQSVGLICDSGSREELTELFAACGLVRIMRAGHQSESFVGEAHDGEYALQRYVRIVNVEP